jgi:hypothetical protein
MQRASTVSKSVFQNAAPLTSSTATLSATPPQTPIAPKGSTHPYVVDLWSSSPEDLNHASEEIIDQLAQGVPLSEVSVAPPFSHPESQSANQPTVMTEYEDDSPFEDIPLNPPPTSANPDPHAAQINPAVAPQINPAAAPQNPPAVTKPQNQPPGQRAVKNKTWALEKFLTYKKACLIGGIFLGVLQAVFFLGVGGALVGLGASITGATHGFGAIIGVPLAMLGIMVAGAGVYGGITKGVDSVRKYQGKETYTAQVKREKAEKRKINAQAKYDKKQGLLAAAAAKAAQAQPANATQPANPAAAGAPAGSSAPQQAVPPGPNTPIRHGPPPPSSPLPALPTGPHSPVRTGPPPPSSPLPALPTGPHSPVRTGPPVPPLNLETIISGVKDEDDTDSTPLISPRQDHGRRLSGDLTAEDNTSKLPFSEALAAVISKEYEEVERKEQERQNTLIQEEIRQHQAEFPPNTSGGNTTTS